MLNKNRKCRHKPEKDNLKQTSIFEAMNKWKKCSLSKHKQKTLHFNSLPIHLSDSDGDEENKPVPPTERQKRKLSFPIFTDDEEDSEEKYSIKEEKPPGPVELIAVNRPNSNRNDLQPIASSTPYKTNETFEEKNSNMPPDCFNSLNPSTESNSSADLDKTIIYKISNESSTIQKSVEKTIRILNDVQITPGKQTLPANQASGCTFPHKKQKLNFRKNSSSSQLTSKNFKNTKKTERSCDNSEDDFEEPIISRTSQFRGKRKELSHNSSKSMISGNLPESSGNSTEEDDLWNAVTQVKNKSLGRSHKSFIATIKNNDTGLGDKSSKAVNRKVNTRFESSTDEDEDEGLCSKTAQAKKKFLERKHQSFVAAKVSNNDDAIPCCSKSLSNLPESTTKTGSEVEDGDRNSTKSKQGEEKESKSSHPKPQSNEVASNDVRPCSKTLSKPEKIIQTSSAVIAKNPSTSKHEAQKEPNSSIPKLKSNETAGYRTVSSKNKRSLVTDAKESSSEDERVGASITTPKKKLKLPIDASRPGNSKEAKSPTKNNPKSDDAMKSKKEGKQSNMNYVREFNKILDLPFHLKNLLKKDKKIIEDFLQMDEKYQYICLKLFTWQQKWYNVFKFCQKIHINLDDNDVVHMFQVFKAKEFIDYDYKTESTLTLLNILDLSDVSDIHTFFKLPKTQNRKADKINKLLNNSNIQSTLTFSKSIEDILRDRIYLKMGDCFKFKRNVYDAFYKAYLLGTFTNPEFANINDYFNNILNLRVVFPEFTTENFVIFNSEKEFIGYSDARKCKNEMLVALERKKYVEVLQIGRLAFAKLQQLVQERNDTDNRHANVPHLKRFLPESAYVGCITLAAQHLTCKYAEDVKEWLEFVQEHTNVEYKLGDRYYFLTWAYMRYLDPPDYTRAAQLLIDVLRNKRHKLTDVQLHDLGHRGHQLKVAKLHKIDQHYHDKIAELVPRPVSSEAFPTRTIDASAIRSDKPGRKRQYYVYDDDGNRNYGSVEEYALMRYKQECDYTDGVHCEGEIIRAMFALLFWDLIYEHYVPYTFVLKIQSVPLDMYSKYFYLNRKSVIDQRLEDISNGWSDETLIKFAKDNWSRHSHETGLCEISTIIMSQDLVESLIVSIGRVVLSKICRRFVENVKAHHSGMPDLLMWNAETKKSKFVEVKGEGDRLSMKQKLWLQYLHSIGADIEVCHVHSIGSKKKKMVKNLNQSQNVSKNKISDKQKEVS